MLKARLALLLPIIASALWTIPVAAQEEATYVVQPGDTLTRIALRFNVTTAELALVNDLANPNLIIAGQKLVLPGSGNLPSFPAVASSPSSGEPSPADPTGLSLTYTVRAGDTLYRIASQYGLTLEALARANDLADVNLIQVGQELVIPLWSATSELSLPPPFARIELSEPVVAQGRTLVVRVSMTEATSLTGDFEGRPVFFVGDGQNYWTIIGIHSLTDPGIYSLGLRATLGDGQQVTTAQNVIVTEGDYGLENITLQPGREGLLDNETVQAEFERVSAIWSQVTPQFRWKGRFQYPVDSNRLTSVFGTRRSYNAGPVSGFHTGTDFGAGVGTPIYAPAAGVVALAEPLTVRGKAVIIDHGLGLFSGYWHQSEIAVRPGQTVAPGDLIGYVGDTGLVTGAHLHWEMRLAGIAVEPLQWTQEVIP
jgi:murein DD-endopeptidase MepM/ murein hydrolase activator NlpD